MRRIISLSILTISIIFFFLGLVTIIKGDVDGMQETFSMIAYLSFFAIPSGVALWMNDKKKASRHL